MVKWDNNVYCNSLLIDIIYFTIFNISISSGEEISCIKDGLSGLRQDYRLVTIILI